MMAPILALSSLATLCLWLFGMVDAWRSARDTTVHRTKPWQSGLTYVLVLVSCHAVALPLLGKYVRDHLVESYLMPSTSMEPGVFKGEYFFADKRYNCPGCKSAVMRGDIALFTAPGDRAQIHIKRIIGLPGDKVEVKGRQVSVNGTVLNTQTLQLFESGQLTENWDGRSWQAAWIGLPMPTPDASLTVPAGQVFVLGDNRSNSLDSRYFGTVPLADIGGKARQIWFSLGDAGVRTERIGKMLE